MNDKKRIKLMIETINKLRKKISYLGNLQDHYIDRYYKEARENNKLWRINYLLKQKNELNINLKLIRR